MAAVIILLLLLLLYLLWSQGKKPGGGATPVDYDLPTLGSDDGIKDTVVIDDPGLWEQVPELLTTDLPEVPL